MMKRFAFLLAAALIATLASAQTWEARDGQLTFEGCYGKQDGVYCDYQFRLTEKQTSKFYWSYNNFKVFKPDGTSITADKVAFADGEFKSYSTTQEIFAGVPVKVQAYFNIPATTPRFLAMEIGKKRVENVPICGNSAAPVTPTTLPVSGVKGFNIKLSNCTQRGQNYTCTATLTPTK